MEEDTKPSAARLHSTTAKGITPAADAEQEGHGTA